MNLAPVRGSYLEKYSGASLVPTRYAPLTGAEARIDELRREIGASPYPGI